MIARWIHKTSITFLKFTIINIYVKRSHNILLVFNVYLWQRCVNIKRYNNLLVLYTFINVLNIQIILIIASSIRLVLAEELVTILIMNVLKNKKKILTTLKDNSFTIKSRGSMLIGSILKFSILKWRTNGDNVLIIIESAKHSSIHITLHWNIWSFVR